MSLELGYACHRAGRSTDALGAFRETASIARALGDIELLARAAIGFEEACWRPAIHDEGAVELLEEAVGGDRRRAVRAPRSGCSARLTRALDFVGEHEQAGRRADEAIAMAALARRPRRPGLGALRRVLVARRVPDDEINAMLVEAVEIGEELGDIEIRAEALSWLVPSYVGALRPRRRPRGARPRSSTWPGG